MSDMERIGHLAVAYVNARFERLAARRERNRIAGEYQEEVGSPHSEDSPHPQGYSAEFLAATCVPQRAYKEALRVEKSARQRLYAAVRKAANSAGDSA